MYSVYKVISKMTKEDGVVYAVLSPEGVCEVVPEDDLKLLTSIGFSMTTVGGVPLSVEDGELVCDVEEYIEEPEEPSESDEDDDYFDLYGDEDTEPEGSDEEPEHDDSDDYSEIYGEDDTGQEVVAEEDDGLYDIYGADDEGSIDETKVAKLYRLLSDDQITILRRYYLWYSQRLFEGARGSGLNTRFSNVNAANRKKEALDKLRGDKDFRYAGFLDTGSIDAGYCCSLGHRVRYMHLAWNVKAGDIDIAFFGQMYNDDFQAAYPDYWNVINSPECLVFGINCIGDFFDVDEECLNQLKQAQRQSLKDMAEMYDIMSANNAQSLVGIKDSFKLMDEVMKTISVLDLKRKMMKQTPIMPLMVSFFYKQFRDADILPPKSLVQEVRSCLVGWTDGTKYFKNQWSRFLRYPDETFYERLRVLVKKSNSGVADELKAYQKRSRSLSSVSEVSPLANFVYIMFTYEICGHYKYTATKEGYHDEGGCDKRLVVAPFTMHYKSSLHNYFEGADFSMDTLLKLFELYSLCSEASAKYGQKDGGYTLSYFYKSYSGGSIREVSLFEQEYGGEPVRPVRDILKKYADSTGADINRLYLVLKFMSIPNASVRGFLDNILKIGFCRTYKLFEDCGVGTWSTGYNRRPKYNMQVLTDRLVTTFAEFDDMYAKLSDFCKTTSEAELAEYEDEKRKEEERKEAERKANEARRAEEVSMKEEPEKDPLADVADIATIEKYEKNPPKTPAEVVEYLNAKGVGSITDPQFDRAKAILGTVAGSGRAPSEKQFYYIKKLYEEIASKPYSGTSASGAQPQAERVKLEDRKDISDAIEWVKGHDIRAKAIAAEQGVADYDLMCRILNSIARYKTISEKQMKYAEMALAIAEEGRM